MWNPNANRQFSIPSHSHFATRHQQMPPGNPSQQSPFACKNSFQIDKYNRLKDQRNQPLAIERSGLHESLDICFDEQIKIVSIFHNNNELESFCVDPLLFAHDIVCKDNKVLFCVKDQISGFIRFKFRVRFASMDGLAKFCASVSNYVSIKSYDEWSRKNNISDVMNSTCHSAASLADISTTSSSSMLLHNTTAASDDTSVVLIQSPPRAAISRSRSADLTAKILCLDSATQTDPLMPSPKQLGLQQQQRNCGNNDKPPPPPQINVYNNIENHVTVEAVREFGRVLHDIMNTLVNGQPHQKPPEPISIAPKKLPAKQAPIPLKKQPIKKAQAPAKQQLPSTIPPPKKQQAKKVLASKSHKKRESKTRSNWTYLEQLNRVQELLKPEKSRKMLQRRRGQQSGNYDLRGAAGEEN